MPLPNPDPSRYDPFDDQLTTRAQDIQNYFQNKEDTKQQSRQQELRRGLPLGPLEEYKKFGEDNPAINAILGFLPGIGEAQGVADMAVAKDEGLVQELLANLAMIPGVRPTRKIIAALDDLGEGGIKTLIYDLEKAGLVDEGMIRRMFTEDGNLRLFHGTGNMDLDDLTHEGLLRATDESTDSWAGPGSYFASNWDSPTNIPESSDDGLLRIIESHVPRKDLDKYMLTNFNDSDLVRIGEGRQYMTGDQTPRMQNVLERMYPNLSPGDRMDAYDVSLMGTDQQYKGLAQRDDDFIDAAQIPQKGPGFSIYDEPGDTTKLWSNSDANRRALSHGVHGNVHSDSTGVAAAVFDPQRNMYSGPLRTVSESDVIDARVQLLRDPKSWIDPDNARSPIPNIDKAESFDPTRLEPRMNMQRQGPEHTVSRGVRELPARKAEKARLVALEAKFPQLHPYRIRMQGAENVEQQMKLITLLAESSPQAAKALAEEFAFDPKLYPKMGIRF